MSPRYLFWSSVILTSFLAQSAWARSTGAPGGRSGAPPERAFCTGCHTTNALNSGPGKVQIELPAGATTYLPGQSIRLTVTVQDPVATRWGFELTARQGDTATPAGTFSLVPGDTNAQILDDSVGKYVTHTQPGTNLGHTGSNSWQVDWMPPANGGPVTFYAAGNAANGNGNNQGDFIYSTTLSVTQADVTVNLPATFKVMPQFIFGGGSPGWYSALYFYNSGDTAVTFPLHYFNNMGNTMAGPGTSGAASELQSITIQPKGLAVVEAPNSGSQADGWAAIELPANVQASGVFRLSVTNAPDQEAVVPLSGNTSKDVLLIFDDRGDERTGVAVVNPTAAEITVTITARDDQGQTIGTRTLTLAARSKSTFFLNESSGLSGMKGKRGTVQFTVPSGAVSVIGLRARGLAFTSVPAIER